MGHKKAHRNLARHLDVGLQNIPQKAALLLLTLDFEGGVFVRNRILNWILRHQSHVDTAIVVAFQQKEVRIGLGQPVLITKSRQDVDILDFL